MARTARFLNRSVVAFHDPAWSPPDVVVIEWIPVEIDRVGAMVPDLMRNYGFQS